MTKYGQNYGAMVKAMAKTMVDPAEIGLVSKGFF